MGGFDNIQADTNFYFGLTLAITASLFIGTSFILKKKALLIITRKGCLRAGSGGYSYLKEWVWWSGLACMGIGEATNFAAYTFAPASLVTPLGVLSVIVSAVLAAIFLKEHLNILGKLGCLLCLLGSTIIVIHAPMTSSAETLATLAINWFSVPFLVYLGSNLVAILVLVIHFVPKYGKNNLIWHILVCSLVGGLMVLSCKSLGTLIKSKFDSNDYASEGNFSWWVIIGLFGAVLGGVFMQMIYLNRALDLFTTSLVTPVYYVFFTTCVLIGSTVLFKEYSLLTPPDIIGSLIGFLTIIIGVFLLNAFNNLEINLKDLKFLQKQKNLASVVLDVNCITQNYNQKNDSTRL